MMILPCAKCGKMTPIHLLDAKPEMFADIQVTHLQLRQAAIDGEQFETLQCQECYGPAWEAADESE